MKIKGAIFDMDGTLINSLIVWKDIWKAVADKYLDGEEGFPGYEIDKKLRTMTLLEGMEMLHEVRGIGKDGYELWKFCTDIIEDFYRNKVEMKSGAMEFLKYLHDNNVKMCIASASALDMVEVAAERCELGKYIPKLLSSCDYGCGKDKPDVFLAAEKFLGTPHGATWIFEDSLLAIETAKKAGFPVVGVYDSCTFGQDRAKALSDEYIDDGGSFTELTDKIT